MSKRFNRKYGFIAMTLSARTSLDDSTTQTDERNKTHKWPTEHNSKTPKQHKTAQNLARTNKMIGMPSLRMMEMFHL